MKNISFLMLIGIIVMGGVLRLIFFGYAPPALNIDEAALGYNAYSVLKTGADEHGKFLPLSLESFGDWKLPVYSYIAIAPISVLGLNEFSTRLPSIIAGISGIALIFFIAQKLFNKKEISLFSSFFFAVSPWNIYFSRAAYEVNLAVTFFLAGLLLFLHSTLSRSKQKVLLIFSAIFFGVTLFTYHSFIIFTPLFCFFICILLFRNIKYKKNALFFIIPLAFFIFISFITNYNTSNDKFTTTTVFTNESILFNRVIDFRNDIVENPPVTDLIFTKYLGIPYHILQNYLNSFSPAFLFDRGGEKLIHNVSGFGNLYAFDAFLLLVGVLAIFYKREKQIPLILGWLIIAPIPSALTIDAPNSTRLFILMPLFVLITGYGAYTIYTYLSHVRFGKVGIAVLSFLFLLNILYFLNLYIVHLPYQRASFWKVGYKELVAATNKYPTKEVVMQGGYEFPYIYFLFYNSYDPNAFRRDVQYYPRTVDGFKHVKSFGRYTFVPVLADIQEKPSVLYIDTQNFHEGDNIISQPNGDPVFKYYEKKE